MNISSPSLPPLALIAGPTASGKSAMALELAERSKGVVINADSAQVYRDLRIVSARPSAQEEQRVPHRLYGYRDGARPFSAADWAKDAVAAIDQAKAEGQLPILVGGTGLYIRTLLDGIAPIPPIHADVREQVRALATKDAYDALLREDEQAAARLRPGDSARIARALEVVRSTGRSIGEWQRHRSGGISERVNLRPLILLPPRDWLYARCDERFEKMFAAEGVAEISSLLDQGLDPLLPVMRAIGVREIAGFIRGELTREEALEKGRIATRQYAKRQYTWFSHQPPADWPRFTRPLDCDGLREALALLQA